MMKSPISKKEGYTLRDDRVISFSHPDRISIEDPLTEVARVGAWRLLAEAVEADVSAFIVSRADLVDEAGRRRVARNGHPRRPPASRARTIWAFRERLARTGAVGALVRSLRSGGSRGGLHPDVGSDRGRDPGVGAEATWHGSGEGGAIDLGWASFGGLEEAAGPVGSGGPRCALDGEIHQGRALPVGLSMVTAKQFPPPARCREEIRYETTATTANSPLIKWLFPALTPR